LDLSKNRKIDIKISRTNSVKKNKIKHLVVVLHGYGADGDDIIGVGNELDDFFPEVEFIAPTAPYICDNNQHGYQWFEIPSVNKYALNNEIKSSAMQLNNFIDNELNIRNLTASDVSIVGFSQGGMMALYLGVTRSNKPLSIISFSGLMLQGVDIKKNIKAPSILMLHGEIDTVISNEYLTSSVNYFKNANIKIESHLIKGLGHGIDRTCISIGASFLNNKISNFYNS